ncbi:MAG: TolC family protein, partial [Halanaerobiales bacterium]
DCPPIEVECRNLAEVEEALKPSRHRRLQLELQLAEKKEAFREARENLIIDVFSQYMQVLELEEELLIREKTAELQQKKVEVTESRYEAGQAAETKLVGAETDYEEALSVQRKTEFELEQLKSNFADTVNLPEDESFNPAPLQEPEKLEIDREEAVKAVVEASFTRRASEKRVQLAELNLSRAEAGSVPEQEVKKLKNELEKAEIEAEKTRREVESDARDLYYRFSEAAEDLRRYRKELDLKEKNYQIVEEQRETGMKTELDVLTAEIELLEAEKEYNRAITGYYTAEMELKQKMGQDLGGEYDAQIKN